MREAAPPGQFPCNRATGRTSRTFAKWRLCTRRPASGSSECRHSPAAPSNVGGLRVIDVPKKDSFVSLSTDQSVFLKSWLKRPIRTGAVAPSSNALARLITRDILPGAGPVIELGPGTGAFTRCILAKGVPACDLTLVENCPDFTALLRQRFPAARLLDMDVTRMRRWRDPW